MRGTRLLIASAALIALLAAFGGWQLDRLLDERSPGELIRHAQKRLIGHPKLEAVALAPLAWAQPLVERPVILLPLSELGRGPRDDIDGQPPATMTVASMAALIDAVSTARAGDVIDIAPGEYRIDSALYPRQPGRADAPITLRAALPGTVVLNSFTVEAIKLSKPHWIIEHLIVRGACANDASCEHAVHVGGAANGTVLRDNRFEDFNAAIKVNGERGAYPDDGAILRNRIVNRAPRRTDDPVTMIDIVGASRWMVADNLIANFVKDGGDGIAYGAFMKGGGSGGRFERNLVVCTPTGISQPGLRVGLSLGGGTTGASSCRSSSCLSEHEGGIVANNVIAHCNDVGIDINRATGSEVRHNTLINTAGITVRGEPSFARVRANLIDGRVRVRMPGELAASDNLTFGVTGKLVDADQLMLRWRDPPPLVPTADEKTDFCGRPRGAMSPPGALIDAC